MNSGRQVFASIRRGGQPLTHPICDNLSMKKRHHARMKAGTGILGACRRLLRLAIRQVEEDGSSWYCQDELPLELPQFSWVPCSSPRFGPGVSAGDVLGSDRANLPLEDAVLVGSAEFWLKLGQADEALRELERLPSGTSNHPWALKVRLAAVHALGDLSGQAHAE